MSLSSGDQHENINYMEYMRDRDYAARARAVFEYNDITLEEVENQIKERKEKEAQPEPELSLQDLGVEEPTDNLQAKSLESAK